MALDIAKLEDKIDKVVAGGIEVSGGALDLKQMSDVMEFAKLMAVSGAAVPKYLQGNPGACLAICSRALRWGMDPFAVAEKSYMVNNKGEERIAYESQLVHAVITARAPLKSRLRYEIGELVEEVDEKTKIKRTVWRPGGTSDERRCKVWGTFKGETEPHEYTSETLGKLREARGRNDFGKVKGSPLWETQPEVQLAYSTVRQWARLFASETMLGVYTPDELEDSEPIDVSPSRGREEMVKSLQSRRLRHTSKTTRGFDPEHVNREVGKANGVIEGDAQRVAATEEKKDGEEDRGTAAGNDAGVQVAGGNPEHRSRHDTVEQGTGGSADLPLGNLEGSTAGSAGPQAQQQAKQSEQDEQGEIFPGDRKRN